MTTEKQKERNKEQSKLFKTVGGRGRYRFGAETKQKDKLKARLGKFATANVGWRSIRPRNYCNFAMLETLAA